MKIEIRNNTFVLHASGAIFWEDQKILLISDVHLGKISHFRKHGLAIPENAIPENFKRMTNMVELFHPEKIIFLGDLFHSKMNDEWKLFADWVASMHLGIILVEGNHDIIGRQNYIDLNVDVCQKLGFGDFLFTHHPMETEGFYNFCGHVHPGIKLKGMGKQSLKLACFFRRENQLILPAFGEFTGNYLIEPEENELVYAIAHNEVIRVF